LTLLITLVSLLLEDMGQETAKLPMLPLIWHQVLQSTPAAASAAAAAAVAARRAWVTDHVPPA
jgi:hypothetical protein